MEFDWNNTPFELGGSLTQREVEESFEDPFAIKLLPDSPRFSVQARFFNLGMAAGGDGIFKRLFYLPLSQRTTQFKGRIIPIELHFELFVCNSPMQCLYFVFTHDIGMRQRFCTEIVTLQQN